MTEETRTRDEIITDTVIARLKASVPITDAKLDIILSDSNIGIIDPEAGLPSYSACKPIIARALKEWYDKLIAEGFTRIVKQGN